MASWWENKIHGMYVQYKSVSKLDDSAFAPLPRRKRHSYYIGVCRLIYQSFHNLHMSPRKHRASTHTRAQHSP